MSDASWVGRIRKGDILRSRGSAVLRVVRRVHHGIRTSIKLSIMHCSWTGRCYTIYTGAGEINRMFERTPYRMKLNRPIDRKIDRELDGLPKSEIQLHCCDVRGIT